MNPFSRAHKRSAYELSGFNNAFKYVKRKKRKQKMATKFKVKVLDPECAPSRAHPTDAGLDLRSTEHIFLRKNSTTLIGTGVYVAIPKGYVGLVFIRSSLAKNGVQLANSVGVIDSDYRGQIKLLLEYEVSVFSNSTGYIVEKGERVAQLVVVPCLLEHEIVDSLDDTKRGDGGFGHSGKY